MSAGLIIPALMIWWVLDNMARHLKRIADAVERSAPEQPQ